MKKKSSILAGSIVFLSAASSQVLKKGDTSIGAKVAVEDVSGASIGFLVNGEYGINNDIGVGGVVAYSGYSEEIAYPGATGEWSYSNIMILGQLNYHYDLFGNPKFDTFAAFNLGFNIASAEWKWTNGSSTFNPSVSAGGVVWGITANARYHVSNNFSLAASLGYGLGFLQVGLDYRL